MTRQRVIVAMLAVFCVLLALNPITGEPEAQAEPQDPETHTGACCLPSGGCSIITPASCASQGGIYHGANTSCGSVDCALPRVVAGAVNSEHISGNNFGDRVWRIWSDGMVDVSVRVFVADGSCDVDAATVCGPVVIIDPGP